MAPKVFIKTHEDLFLEVTSKRGVYGLVEENLKAKVAQKTFRASLGKFGQNPLHPKNLPAPTLMMKRHLRPRCSSFGRAEEEMPTPWLHSRRPCAYYSTRTLFTRCCRL